MAEHTKIIPITVEWDDEFISYEDIFTDMELRCNRGDGYSIEENNDEVLFSFRGVALSPNECFGDGPGNGKVDKACLGRLRDMANMRREETALKLLDIIESLLDIEND